MNTKHSGYSIMTVDSSVSPFLSVGVYQFSYKFSACTMHVTIDLERSNDSV